VRAVPGRCELYPGICLTTEEKHRKKTQDSRRVPVGKMETECTVCTVYSLVASSPVIFLCVCPFRRLCRSEFFSNRILLFRKVWESVKEIPLEIIFKLYCRNISPLSDSTFDMFLYFVHCGLHQWEYLSYFLLWGEWHITVKSYTFVGVAGQSSSFQNIWSTSGLPANWWTLHHLVQTTRHELPPP